MSTPVARAVPAARHVAHSLSCTTAAGNSESVNGCSPTAWQAEGRRPQSLLLWPFLSLFQAGALSPFCFGLFFLCSRLAPSVPFALAFSFSVPGWRPQSILLWPFLSLFPVWQTYGVVQRCKNNGRYPLCRRPAMPPTCYAADPLCRRPAMPPTRYAADPHYAIFIGNNRVFRKSLNRTDRRFK